MSTPYHHGDLRSVLLSYSREQMEGGGLDALSMREMAKAVGVSHAAAYRHFRDKEALLQAVALQGFEEMRASILSAAETSSPQPRAKLQAIGLAYVRFGLMHPRLLAHMFSTISQPQATRELVESGAQLFEQLLDQVNRGQHEGVMRPGDARQLSHACWAMVHGLSTLLGVGILRAPDADLNALLHSAEQALEVFLDGIVRMN